MDLSDVGEQYWDMVNDQAKLQREAKQLKGMKQHFRLTKEALRDEFMQELELRDTKTRQSRQLLVSSSFIPSSYYPCNVELATLKEMGLSNLQLEVHHRGKFLLLRCITPPSRLTAIMTIVEDVHGNASTLQLYNQDDESVRPASSVINVGSVLIVKEPYSTIMGNKGFSVRVDHPSDVLFLRKGDDRIPETWRTVSNAMESTAETLKAQGNKAIGEGRYWDAIHDYTDALDRATTDEAEIIKRNRALANLKTKNFDAALADAGYPLCDEKSSPKSLFRAAEALYALERFEESHKVLKMLLAADSYQKEAQASTKRVEDRLREQKAGNYDFGKLQAEAQSLHPPCLDHATYSSPIEIRQTKDRGRAVFLTKSVEAGELLLCEKAFQYAYSDDNHPSHSILLYTDTDRGYRGAQADIWKLAVQKLHHNPSLAAKFMDLHHGSYKARELKTIDGQLVVDSFLVEKLSGLNAFACPTSHLQMHRDMTSNDTLNKRLEDGVISCAVWILASYFNHSCLASAERSFFGDMIVVRAAKDLSAGDEVTIAYKIPDWESSEPHKSFADWGFVCDCVLCEEATTIDVAVKARRVGLLARARAMIDVAIKSGGKVDIDHIEGLMREAEGTYARPAHEAPRLQLYTNFLGLTGVAARRGDHQKRLEYEAKAVTSLGFVLTGASASSVVPFAVVKWGYAKDALVHNFIGIASVFLLLGKIQSAKNAGRAARTVYKILVGEDDTFKDTYKQGR